MNLNETFENYKDQKFFEEITFADLKSDVLFFSRKIPANQFFGVKTKSPYFTFVAILAGLLKKAQPVLLSHLETEKSLTVYRSQIDFLTLYTDDDFHMEKASGDLPDIGFEQIAAIVFSSGSSSTPKGIALSLGALYYSSLGFIEFFKLHKSETTLLNLPHHHVGGLMMMWRAFFSGGNITTDQQVHFDLLSLVPLQLKRWMDDPEKLVKLKNARIILIGGSKFDDSLKAKAQEFSLKTFETYGMSETASLVSIDGIVLPYREMKIGEDGTIFLKGKTLASGYYINQQFIPLTQDWFKTNDKGHESEGKFFFDERSDLIFVSGGENINPLQVEHAVKTHPDIKDAYCVSLQDEKWGQMGVLLYEADKEINPDFLKEHLHPHHIPKYFFRIKLNFEGQLKVKRNELRKIAYEHYLKHIFSFDFYERKDRPTMVMFHGFLGDKEDLKIVTAELRNNYSLLYIDLPGHGKTSAQHFHSLDDLLKKLSDLIKLFGEKFLFYGYSMGGRVALQLSLNYLQPTFLIIESSGLGLTTHEEAQKRKKEDMQLFDDVTQENITQFLNRWYSNTMFKAFKNHQDYRPEIRRKELNDVREWKLSQTILSQGDFPLMEENLNKLKKLTFPILYFYGEEDPKYSQYAVVLKSLGHKTIKILGAGHNPHKTQASEIKAYLNLSLK